MSCILPCITCDGDASVCTSCTLPLVLQSSRCNSPIPNDGEKNDGEADGEKLPTLPAESLVIQK